MIGSKKDVMVPSKNIGVAMVDGELKLCIIKFADNSDKITYACSLISGKEVEPAYVTPLNNMFIKKEMPDREAYGNMIAQLIKNEECPFVANIKSDKSIALLSRISIYQPDIFWYNEEEGVHVVNVEPERKFPLKKLKKIEANVNHYEKVQRKKIQKEEDIER